MMKVTNDQILEIAKNNSIENAMLRSFIATESGEYGFDPKTGKIIIQFEPGYFRRLAPEAYKKHLALNGVIKSGKQLSHDSLKLFTDLTIIFNNKVEGQAKEWIAFNLAFKINPIAAMRSTSIGMGQVMGDNFKALGYNSVGEMWDDAKRGEYQQVLQMVRFIRSKPQLYTAIKEKNFHLIACNYNGFGYLAMAKRLNREPYNITLEKNYKKYK